VLIKYGQKPCVINIIKRINEAEIQSASFYQTHANYKWMHHTYGQWESASKMTMFVLYCIAYYKYISVIAKETGQKDKKRSTKHTYRIKL
jgi:hypothetical protein